MNNQTGGRSEEGRRLMVSSAALIYAGAGALNLLEASIPGGPATALLPGIAAICVALVLQLQGSRLPTLALAATGPIGAALIAYGLADVPGSGDGALLYVWPVLWEAYFFGRRGAIGIVAWVGLVHGLALLSMPPGVGYFDRWLDVVVSVGVVATVVELLAMRNRTLLTQLARDAQVDKLTGLLNRRGFAERAGAELSRAQRELSSLSIASFDLDHFKVINDEFGHDVGDQVLVRTAAAFEAELRESDVLARMGGEEFVALLPGLQVDGAKAFAERVRVVLESDRGPGLPPVTVSAGIASEIAPGELEPLLQAADRALYQAKFGGRNQTIVHVP